MTKCVCGVKLASECDEEWGPDCDLGNNEKYVKVAAQPAATKDWPVVKDAARIASAQLGYYRKMMGATPPAAAQPSEPVAEVCDLVIEVRERLMRRGLKNRDALYATPPAAAQPSGEPVAVIGPAYQLLWASGEPLTDTVNRTGIKVGSVLYAAPPAAAQVPLTPAQMHADELHLVMQTLYLAGGIWPDLLPRVQGVLAKIEAAGQE